MSDVATVPAAQAPPGSATPDLPRLIMSVAEPIWKKISQTLGVKTREEAAQLVMQDEKAAAVVIQIIQSSGKSALTQKQEASSKTALTSKAAARAPIEQTLWGAGGNANLQY